ncbi:MAG: TonB-dependent receptor, partial [Phenylobacterium sp.]
MLRATLSPTRRFRSLLLAGCVPASLLFAGTAVAQADGQASTKTAPGAVSEIIVTAEKRSQRLQEVPSSIGVLSAETLETLHANSVADLSGFVPGLVVQTGGSPGQTRFTLRGIATSNQVLLGGSPLVATYVNDTPLGASYGATGTNAGMLDLAPYDLSRIEVLNGPQGTLYGASGMGGVIKYVLKQPSLSGREIDIGGGLEATEGTGRLGGSGHAALSAPLIADQLAVRISGFYHNAPGYITNVGLGVRHENDYDQGGARAALVWTPAPRLRVEATAMFQNVNADGNAAVSVNEATREPVYGDWARSTVTPEAFKQRVQYYALRATYDLDFATLSSATSWSRIHNIATQDATENFGGLVRLINNGVNVPATLPITVDGKVRKFTEEVRLTSPGTGVLQWMVGGFYTREEGLNVQNLRAFTLAGAPINGDRGLLYVYWPSDFDEVAVFGNATWT